MNRLEKFLLPYSSKQTVRLYRNHLKRYFSTFGKVESLDQSTEKYFSQKRDYEDDVVLNFSSIKDWAPLSVGVSMSIVKTFLMENDIEFTQRFWKSLLRKKKGNRALTQDRVPSLEELRGILSQLPLNGRALFLTLASSGMRIGETLQLKIGDFDFTKDPTHIHIRGDYTKTGNSRLAFISSEATECVKEWLKVRPAWLNKYRVTDTGRAFPFKKSAPLMFNRALSRTGLLEKDESTGRYTIHPHVLRKFFRTSLATEMQVDIIEALMGHEAYLTECYRKFTPDQLAVFYKKAEHLVTVFGEVKEGEELSEVLRENISIRRELDELKKSMQWLMDQLPLSPQEYKGLQAVAQDYLKKTLYQFEDDDSHPPISIADNHR